ncbi:MAG TPA: hypothetical protein VFZ65_10190 [Planctomycetota bacterium]|nr:hypothetical protein [Planctomycetota bacterium]
MSSPRACARWLAWLAAAAGTAGCIGSSVVATEDRLVVPRLEDLQFTPAAGLQLSGLYESIEVRGDAAVSLRKVYYLFGPDGSYTAAALTEADGVPSFQTLNGTWRSDEAGLSLDGGAPVLLEQAPEHLRITAPNGVLVLRRGSLQ